MVALSFPPKSSRLRLPLSRLHDFPLFAGSRLRVRVGVLLTFVLLCVGLVSILRRDRGPYKFHLNLSDDLTTFQKEYLAEHAALGK